MTDEAVSALPFPIPQDVADAHPMLLVTSAPRLGWWAECECGWIGPGYRTEASAVASHEAHQRRQVGAS